MDAVLVRVLSDVLALGDIPEVDSRRLAELCRILSSLESSFFDLEDPNAVSHTVSFFLSFFYRKNYRLFMTDMCGCPIVIKGG